jgi:hypothetical protein
MTAVHRSDVYLVSLSDMTVDGKNPLHRTLVNSNSAMSSVEADCHNYVTQVVGPLATVATDRLSPSSILNLFELFHERLNCQWRDT